MALAQVQISKNETGITQDTESSNDSSSENETAESAPEEGNTGWADSIAKILRTNKPKSKKTLVLSRAKKLKKESEKKSEKIDFDFEVAKGDGSGVIEEEKKPIKDELDEALSKPKNLILSLRVKPNWKDAERERTLRKVATRGVVQLFNTVRLQQKSLQEELEAAGPLDSRRDAVLKNIDKRKFLDVLMSGDRAKSTVVDSKIKAEKTESSSSEDEELEKNKKKKKWDVLESDYMTGKKSKHWDEKDEHEQETDDAQSTATNESDEET